jgi:hypothetical protein
LAAAVPVTSTATIPVSAAIPVAAATVPVPIAVTAIPATVPVPMAALIGQGRTDQIMEGIDRGEGCACKAQRDEA